MNLKYLTLEPPREGHATYTHVHEIISGLKRRSWVVTLYEPPYTKLPKSPSLPMRLLHSLLLQTRLWAEWEKGAVLYIRAHYLAFPSALIAKLLRVPIIHEINGPYDDVFIAHPSLKKVAPLLVWMQKQQYRWATGRISVTQELCKFIEAGCGGASVYFIPNAANTNLFHKNYEKPEGLPAKYVIFFGAMAKWHRIPVILEAFSTSVWPQDTDIVFVGDGADKPLVDAVAAQNSRIHALGRRPYKDIPAIAAHALCGLVTTGNVDQGNASGQRTQTGLYPLKLFETLACGTPVIVTDFPGQADLVRNGDCGVVIEPDNAQQLAQAVRELSANPDAAREKGERGATLIATQHTWDARAQTTHDYINALLENQKKH